MSIKLVIVTTRPSELTPWFDEIDGNIEKIADIIANLEASPGYLGTTVITEPLKRTKTIEFADDVTLRNYVTANEADIQRRGSVTEDYLLEHGCTQDIYLA